MASSSDPKQYSWWSMSSFEVRLQPKVGPQIYLDVRIATSEEFLNKVLIPFVPYFCPSFLKFKKDGVLKFRYYSSKRKLSTSQCLFSLKKQDLNQTILSIVNFDQEEEKESKSSKSKIQLPQVFLMNDKAIRSFKRLHEIKYLRQPNPNHPVVEKRGVDGNQEIWSTHIHTITHIQIPKLQKTNCLFDLKKLKYYQINHFGWVYFYQSSKSGNQIKVFNIHCLEDNKLFFDSILKEFPHIQNIENFL